MCCVNWMHVCVNCSLIIKGWIATIYEIRLSITGYIAAIMCPGGQWLWLWTPSFTVKDDIRGNLQYNHAIDWATVCMEMLLKRGDIIFYIDFKLVWSLSLYRTRSLRVNECNTNNGLWHPTNHMQRRVCRYFMKPNRPKTISTPPHPTPHHIM